MQRAIIFAAVLASLSPLAITTAQANSADITIAPGITLHLGDRDDRGHYWDGDRWRDDRWWRDNYRWNEGRWWRQEEWRRHQEWERQQAWREEQRRRQWEHHQRGRGPGGPDGHDHRGGPGPDWEDHRGHDH